MEELIVPIILLILGVPLCVGIWLIIRAVSARGQIVELNRRVDDLQSQLATLKQQRPVAPKTTGEEISAFMPAPLPPRKEEPQFAVPPPIPAQSVGEVLPAYIPEMKAPPVPKLEPVAPSIANSSRPADSTFVPPVHPIHPPPTPKSPVPQINWEQFLGVKGLAWISGLALFLGCAFAIQYSFEHNLIRPEIRMALGFVAGFALLVGGMVLHRRKQYVVGAQTLCATGVVVLYAITFACRTLYHFEFFGPLPTFLFMVLITTTAFYLAVRLDALVVAILGMLGGFVT
ncbi:MAG TPA: DUF2339 domain-containing protein, partial [Verrucomicrobiae bacterium]|nr:DUF2339 domain-containing protein [Verrucomicrobiae bacterium]